MSKSPPSQQDASGSIPLASIDPNSLLKQQGTVPFCGLSTTAEYPDCVNTSGARFSSQSSTFKEALGVLPQAGEGTLWAENEFVAVTEDGSTTVDADAIDDVHGISIPEIEAEAGADIETLASNTDLTPLSEVTDHKDIIDRRRLVLDTLFDTDVKFRWQIASDTYEPGDMQKFLQRKIAAANKQVGDDAFGWIRHYDWGGSVVITTIYPSLAEDVGLPDDINLDSADGSLTLASSSLNQAEPDSQETTDDELTVFYGDQLGYDFRGTQTLWAYPVIYVPNRDVMIQLPEPKFKRRHVGNFMDPTEERTQDRVPPIEWHERILSKLDALTTSINNDIVRARLLGIDFGAVPFSVTEFYEYLGIPTDYAETAAERATQLAATTGYDCPADDCSWTFETEPQLHQHHQAVHGSPLGELDAALTADDFPHPKPSLWNLQISLKIALLDKFTGTKAGDTFQGYQELAGQILQHPRHQLTLAYREHDRQASAQSESAGDTLVDGQQETLGDSLEEVLDLPGVTEDSISATEAQQLNDRVQQQLDSF